MPLLLAALSLVAAESGHAADARPAYAKEVWQLGLSGAYAHGFGAFGSGGSPNEDVRMGVALLSLGRPLSDVLAVGSPLEGSISAHLEAELLWNREPQSGFGGGATFRLRYHWLRFARYGVVPYLDGGAGMGSIDFDLPSQSDGFSFLLGGGVGLQLHLSEHFALTLGWRYHHISNAGTRRPNVSINDHLYNAGLILFLPSAAPAMVSR